LNIFRAKIFHTPANPFHDDNALAALEDGALAFEGGVIAACGAYHEVRAAYPDAHVRDLRGGCLLPGFIDTHIHFPQVRIVGALGYTLLDWLDQVTLPEEARLADPVYARAIAGEFVRNLAAHGTTTALVFGAHFAAATEALFDEAARAGLRMISGLVLSDRLLRPDLLQSPETAYCESVRLIRSVGGNSKLGYAVIPRFALSTSAAMLEVCRELLREFPQTLFTTHINENALEIEETCRSFPESRDYLAVYERFDLISRRSVLAHNVHSSDSQLRRLASAGASVAHCPCSNAALGSGLFPMRRHLNHGVHFALGTDIGAGIGFGMMKEALHAYLLQRVAADRTTLTPAQMLYLATRAGAEALGMSDRVGDFTPGKAADFVYLKPPLEREIGLGALFTMADAQWIRETRVAGDLVYENG
jgi:guanine deaminase